MNTALGVRQRRMLVSMLTVGNGALPASWRLNWHDRSVLATLCNRGLVDPATERPTLTAEGLAAANRFRGDRWLTHSKELPS